MTFPALWKKSGIWSRTHRLFMDFISAAALLLMAGTKQADWIGKYSFEQKGGILMKYLKLEDFERADVFGKGEPNQAFAPYFTGESYLKPLTDPQRTAVFLANITFAPGCRNHWHIHHATSGGGQLLICTAGEGWYVEENKPAVPLHAGMVITIPPEVKHWHGAKKDSWFSHIAIEVPGENTTNEWCEPVNDEDYNKLEEI